MLKFLFPFLFAGALIVGPVRADPTQKITQKLIGLSEETLLMCAGIPDAKMKSGKSTFFVGGFEEAIWSVLRD